MYAKLVYGVLYSQVKSNPCTDIAIEGKCHNSFTVVIQIFQDLLIFMNIVKQSVVTCALVIIKRMKRWSLFRYIL